jgi:hypothetical protein
MSHRHALAIDTHGEEAALRAAAVELASGELAAAYPRASAPGPRPISANLSPCIVEEAKIWRKDG